MGIIKTERIILKKINQDDYEEMKIILQDKKLMSVGWGKTYSDEEVQAWIDKIIEQYDVFGYSYYLGVEKSTNEVIGIMGILPVTIKSTEYIEVAYILKEKFWGKGYATKGIKGCVNYIFNTIGADRYIAQVIPENTSSSKVAKRLGMKVIDDYMREHNGKEELHLIYALTKEDYIKQKD